MTHRRAEIVSDLVSEGDVGDFRGNMGSVVLYGDDACVQRLLLPIRVQLTFLTDTTGTSYTHQKHTHAHTHAHTHTQTHTHTHTCRHTHTDTHTHTHTHTHT